MSCIGQTFDTTDVLRTSDVVSPSIAVTSPVDGDAYHPTVTVAGEIVDFSVGDERGAVADASYELIGTSIAGEIAVGGNGGFSFTFSTEGITGTVELLIRAIDWNANVGRSVLRMVPAKELASFVLLASRNAALASDVVGTFDGLAVSLAVPDGTPVDSLIPDFDYYGVSVAVDGVEQTSAVTIQDFSSPVYYVVTANDGTKNTYAIETTATPIAPGVLSADALSTSEVSLSWSDDSTNEDGFEVQRKKGIGGTFATIATTAAGTASLLDGGLSSGTEYYYRVRARNTHGVSAWSPTAYASTRSFTTETVDSSGTIQFFSSVAVDSLDREHLAYYDGVGNDLLYAMYDGTAWTLQNVDTTGLVGRYPSLAVDSANLPHISYYDETNTGLKYARWSGTEWHVETVTTQGGEFTSLALDSMGHPHITYVQDGGDLGYARFDGSQWNTELIDSDASAYLGEYSSLVLDASDNPHVAYHDLTNVDLKYARWDGTQWQIEVVDGIGNVGAQASLALDSLGNPHISYRQDTTTFNLQYAYWNGSTWHTETVRSSGDVGVRTALALDDADRPGIAHWDLANKDLLYVTWDGAAWQDHVIDTAGDVGNGLSIGLDSQFRPILSYVDETNGTVKVARALWP